MGTVQNGFDLSQYRGELQSENRIDIAVRVKKLTKMSEEVLRYVINYLLISDSGVRFQTVRINLFFRIYLFWS